MSLLPADCRGLRVLVAGLENAAPVDKPEDGLRENAQSMSHTRMLSATAPARMDRKTARQMRNKSCGRTPTLQANASMPSLVPDGSKNRVLGVVEFRCRGEEGSFI